MPHYLELELFKTQN